MWLETTCVWLSITPQHLAGCQHTAAIQEMLTERAWPGKGGGQHTTCIYLQSYFNFFWMLQSVKAILAKRHLMFCQDKLTVN